MLEAKYTLTEKELVDTLLVFNEMDSRETRAPWLLKLFMGKGRPRYRWQVWLANNWPTKEIPKERRLSTAMNNELTKEIDKAILEEIMKQIKQDKQ